MLKFAMCASALVWLGSAAFAQQYSISTVAGGAPPSTPSTATSISVGQPARVAADSAGNFYFSSSNAVFKVSSNGTMSLVAGNSRAGFSGDGGPAVNAQLNGPQGIAIDKKGNIFIADSFNNRVRIVTPDGTINTYAGNGTVGTPRFWGDGGPGPQANLHLPGGLAVDSNGNLFIADTADNAIREVTAADGLITTVAGTGDGGYSGDTFLAVDATLNHPQDVAVDSSGNIYVADTSNGLIRKITTDGKINYLVGNVTNGIVTTGYSGDNGPAGKAGLVEPYGVAVDSSGNLYIAQPTDGRIRQVSATNGNIYTIVGTGTLSFTGDGGPATAATLNRPYSVALDSSGNLYIADSLNNRIRMVTKSGAGNISTVAGSGFYSYSGDGGPATRGQFNGPKAVAVDSAGNLFVADTANNVVRRTTSGVLSTIAGNTAPGFGGDNGNANSAQLYSPQGIAVDSAGNVYVADFANSRIRKISGGTISTYAGSSTVGYGGDGGAATSAQLNGPTGLALDSKGNLYIADTNNSVIRLVNTAGVITTIAGNGRQGYSGDGGAALSAQLNYPQGVAVDAAGNIYIADTGNNRVRMVSGGTITTIGGNGSAGYSGDGGPATSAQIGSPTGIAVDASGGVYVSDGNSVVRNFFVSGAVATVAGTGVSGYSGDGGPANNAQLSRPTGLAVDQQGRLYISDTANNAIRQLQFTGAGISVSAVTNGASNQTGSLSPGEVIVLYGSGMGPSGVTGFQLVKGVLPTSIAGTSVYINDVPAPMLYTSAGQVAAIVPYAISGSTAQVYVSYQGQSSSPVSVPVASLSPALFSLDGSGTGQAAAVNQDGSVNSSAHPAPAGKYVLLYGTGFGQTNPGGNDGTVNKVPLPLIEANVTVTVGGKSATINYAGAAPGAPAGVMQINVEIPAGVAAGNVPVVVQAGSLSTQSTVTIAVSGS